jgi:DNA-binding NarL/FixJ family response regulator
MSSKRHENQFTRNADASSNDEWDWESNPDRWVKHRSPYIERTTDFDSTDAEVIAWAELGYSHSGIAKKIDISRSATKSRMSRIDEAFDCEYDSALWTRRPGYIEIQSPVGIDGTVWGGDDDE